MIPRRGNIVKGKAEKDKMRVADAWALYIHAVVDALAHSYSKVDMSQLLYIFFIA